MDKKNGIEEVKNSLIRQINSARDNDEPLDTCSWQYQNGILITVNEADQIVDALKDMRFSLQDFQEFAKKVVSGEFSDLTNETIDYYIKSLYSKNKDPEKAEKKEITKVKSAYIFSNGNICYFDFNGQQIGDLQSKSWIELIFEYLESKGIDPSNIPTIETVVNGNIKYIKAVKRADGWNCSFSITNSAIIFMGYTYFIALIDYL